MKRIATITLAVAIFSVVSHHHALAVPPNTLALGEMQTILALPVGDNPEGIAVDGPNIYVGNRRFVELDGGVVYESEILKIRANGQVDLFATLPDSLVTSNGVLGLTTDRQGNVYAALDTGDVATRGVWRFSKTQSASERLVGSENMEFPNALTFDDAGNLYATDSLQGAVWRFTSDGSAPQEPWAQDELLEPDPLNPFGFDLPGANGIAFFSDVLYVANTEKGLVSQIPINPDGSAGDAELLAADPRLLSADGIATDKNGDIHVVIPGHVPLEQLFESAFAPLVRIDATSGEVTSTVFDDPEMPQFDVPLSLAFGTIGPEQESVFITNGDTLDVGGPGPRILQVGVGVDGFILRGNPKANRVAKLR
jgi:sugar lactone lactonase YvrE